MNLAQLVEHCIIYVGGRSSNLGHPTYHLKVEFLAISLLEKKKKEEREGISILEQIMMFVT
jgi:hypothetical protein